MSRPRYGTFHALPDFLGSLVPNRANSSPQTIFFHEVIAGLKRLDAVQESNGWVTLSVSTGGGVWITYEGLRRWYVQPGQGHVRVATNWRTSDAEPDIAPVLDVACEADDGTEDMTATDEYRQWRLRTDGLEAFVTFIEGLPGPDVEEAARVGHHPRTFPGWAREEALSEFEHKGSICPGVAKPGSERAPHKLGPDERIEFDHVLPYSRRGPSSASNIQILCVECNRIKGATAA